MAGAAPKTVSARVRLVVLSLAAVIVVGGIIASVLREAHLDQAGDAFLSEATDMFPNAYVAIDTLECGESLSAGMFKDETVHCQVDVIIRDQAGHVRGYMPPDFEWVDVAFHSDD